MHVTRGPRFAYYISIVLHVYVLGPVLSLINTSLYTMPVPALLVDIFYFTIISIYSMFGTLFVMGLAVLFIGILFSIYTLPGLATRGLPGAVYFIIIKCPNKLHF